MANLFGTGINQVPTNGMLGNMAFQDKAYLSVDKIGIGTTATDTGTANQTLQNYGSAYISGNLGIGATLPGSNIRLDVLGGEIRAGRIDSSNEGGQLSFSRASDNTTAWYIDVFGNTSTPNLRIVDSLNSTVRAQFDGSGNFAVGPNLAPTSRLHIAAGTTSSGTAPLEISSGSLLSVVESDVFEYDGINLYHTDNNITTGNGRAVIQEVRYRRLTTSNANVGVAATNPFGVGVGSFTVLANELYEFEANLYMTKVTNGTLTYTFALTTGSFVSLSATVHPIVGISNAETVTGRGVFGATANPTTTAATGSLTGARTYASRITATFIPTVNSSFSLQMTNSAGTATISPDSYMKLVALGSTTFIGNVT